MSYSIIFTYIALKGNNPTILVDVHKMNTINVHYLNIMENNQDYLNLLRKIKNKPNFSQRKLANELGFSLGKLNYCLNALRLKGLVKIKNFKNNKNKINYIYVLTPKGITKKAKLTLNFMRRKIKEYEELSKELDKD